MRPWLALKHAGAGFVTQTADVELGKRRPNDPQDATEERQGAKLAERRKMGSVTGLFPTLHVTGGAGDHVAIHESLAICEWVNEAFPAAGLWPDDGLARARARAISCEMLTGFANVRTHLSCHLFGRLAKPLSLDPITQREIDRIFEIWSEALERSGGPYLFGRFTIADAMYYPIRTRFRTYGVALPDGLERYATTLDETPAVRSLVEVARTAPRAPVYDGYLRDLGGDPEGA